MSVTILPTQPEILAPVTNFRGITPGRRVMARLKLEHIPETTGGLMGVVGRHSNGVEIDPGDYQGRHQADEFVAVQA